MVAGKGTGAVISVVKTSSILGCLRGGDPIMFRD